MPTAASAPTASAPEKPSSVEDGADARHVVREIGRLAHRKRARARKLDLHDVDHAPRRRRHNDDLVGKKHGLGNAVGDEQHGLGIGEPQPLQLEIELVAGHGVERAERFVHEQQRRIEQQRAADGDALAHAAGELPRVAFGVAGKPDHGEQARGLVAPFGKGQPPDARGQENVAEHGEPVEQHVALEDDAHVARRVGHGAAGKHDAAGGRPLEARDTAQQRALAASARPKQAHELRRADGEAHLLERDNGARPRRINFCQPRDGEKIPRVV